MNILEQANEIVNNRDNEKAKQYGPFSISMDKAATIASIMSGKTITKDDCYNVIIAMKFARESHAHKEDNILDAIAYLAQKNNDLENPSVYHRDNY